MPAEHKTKLSMMRRLKKADCEAGFFFMTDFVDFVQMANGSHRIGVKFGPRRSAFQVLARGSTRWLESIGCLTFVS
jgi:hypothetical protein